MVKLKKPHFHSLILLVVLGTLLAAVMVYRWRQPLPSCSQDLDLLILGAEVFDGTGGDPFLADIGIRDRRIVCVGELADVRAEQTLDAHGLSVAPGFIDVHTHIERNVPTNSPFVAGNFVQQGVTTIITGNCGRSFLNIGKFFKLVEANGTQVNLASLIGHNTIRQSVMKQASGAPSRDQLMSMGKLVDEAIEDGAMGMSTGLVYIPGTFAKTEEIEELAKRLSRNNGIYVSHIRDEGTKGLEALQEAIAIGQHAGVAVHISHFKAQGPQQWGTAQARLDLVKSARENRQRVSLDQYPYNASSTGLAVLVPSWLSEENLATVKRKLSDPSIRARVRTEMLSRLRDEGWADYSFARIAYYRFDESLVGLNIAEIAAKARKPEALSQHLSSAPPASTEDELRRQADTVLDLFTHGGAQMVFFDMAEEDIETIMKDPDVMFGSDSSVRSDTSSSRPHPRGYGTFPRIIGLYSRDKAFFPIQEAIRRMTSLPAATFGIKNRGYIRNDYWADLVIFDRNQILDAATYEEPLNVPNGISYVIVNGSIVIDRQILTRNYPGSVIRHDSASAE